MKVLNNLTSLNVTLEDLYKAKDKQINIHLSDKAYTFNVVLKDSANRIDCKMSSFGANLWMRTNKGLQYEKYKTLGSLQSALVRAIKNKVDSEGDISFSINKEVYSF